MAVSGQLQPFEAAEPLLASPDLDVRWEALHHPVLTGGPHLPEEAPLWLPRRPGHHGAQLAAAGPRLAGRVQGEVSFQTLGTPNS